MQLSNSTITGWKRCRRRWYLGTYLELGTPPSRQVPTGVAELGTRVHLALEAYYGHDLDPISVLHLVYAWATDEWPAFADDLRKEESYAVTMVAGYLDWAEQEGLDAGLRVVATEQVVSHELELISGDSVTLVGKLDQQIVRESDGALLTRDWKTVGTLSKADGIIRDEQMRFYAMLQAFTALETGRRADGLLYTMLLRSKRTARAKGPFYRQVEVSYNRHDLNSMWLRVNEVAQEILTITRRLDDGESHLQVAYPNPGDYCAWACPFVNFCHMADDGSRFEDALRDNFVKVNPWAYYGDDLLKQVLQEFSTGRPSDIVDTTGGDRPLESRNEGGE